MAKQLEETIPMSVIFPENDEDEMVVIFEFTAGSAEFIPSYATPEDYDPGSPDEFYIVRAATLVGDKLMPIPVPQDRADLISEYLNENWERPVDDRDER